MLQIFEGTALTRSFSKVFVSLAAVCAMLAGCASGGNVTTSEKQGVFVASATATGGRLAWARAHERAVSKATDYCASRGMHTSVVFEHTQGIEAMQQHESVIQFECHPKLL